MNQRKAHFVRFSFFTFFVFISFSFITVSVVGKTEKPALAVKFDILINQLKNDYSAFSEKKSKKYTIIKSEDLKISKAEKSIKIYYTSEVSECSGDDIETNYYDSGFVSGGEIEVNYFFVGNFKTSLSWLKSGTSIETVISKMGKPFRHNKKVVTYAMKDESESAFSDKPVYFDGIRFFFKSGKLNAIWIQEKYLC